MNGEDWKAIHAIQSPDGKSLLDPWRLPVVQRLSACVFWSSWIIQAPKPGGSMDPIEVEHDHHTASLDQHLSSFNIIYISRTLNHCLYGINVSTLQCIIIYDYKASMEEY